MLQNNNKHEFQTGFSCKCNDGYPGENCETRQEGMHPESECLAKKCLNGGTCVPVLSPTNSSGMYAQSILVKFK